VRGHSSVLIPGSNLPINQGRITIRWYEAITKTPQVDSEHTKMTIKFLSGRKISTDAI
jgi:hypothetical protein